MSEPEDPSPPYQVDASKLVRRIIVELHRQAVEQGRGQSFVAAYKQIIERLRHDPRGFGEPDYRLASLRLLVRTCVVRPLVVHFAVHEEQPVVFIKGAKLLSDE
jgi:hypothetical protein